MSWQTNAKCRGVDPAIFFPESQGRNNSAAAKTICAVCPVQLECLEWAMEHRERLGVWGGLTARERRYLRERTLRRMPVRHGVCVVCGENFTYAPRSGPAPVTCSDLCAWERTHEQHRAYFARKRAERGQGLNVVTGLVGDTRRRQHGTLATYRSGCKCGACMKAAAAERKRARLVHATAMASA